MLYRVNGEGLWIWWMYKVRVVVDGGWWMVDGGWWIVDGGWWMVRDRVRPLEQAFNCALQGRVTDYRLRFRIRIKVIRSLTLELMSSDRIIGLGL